MPALEPYIIAGPPAALRPLLDLLEANPETAVHEVVRNAAGDPSRLVVSMDPARAVALATALGGIPILIEPNQLLDL